MQLPHVEQSAVQLVRPQSSRHQAIELLLQRHCPAQVPQVSQPKSDEQWLAIGRAHCTVQTAVVPPWQTHWSVQVAHD
jgi:hypothetical protein